MNLMDSNLTPQEWQESELRRYSVPVGLRLREYGPLTAISKGSGDDRQFIVVGYASPQVVDREKHLIKREALAEDLPRFLAHPHYRNANIVHSNIQVAEVLPSWTDPETGEEWTTHVDEVGLFCVVKIRTDKFRPAICDRVEEDILSGKLNSFSISGDAPFESRKYACANGSCFWVIEKIELYEITICEEGVNQDAKFSVVSKADAMRLSTFCADGSCPLYEEDSVVVTKAGAFSGGGGTQGGQLAEPATSAEGAESPTAQEDPRAADRMEGGDQTAAKAESPTTDEKDAYKRVSDAHDQLEDIYRNAQELGLDEDTYRAISQAHELLEQALDTPAFRDHEEGADPTAEDSMYRGEVSPSVSPPGNTTAPDRLSLLERGLDFGYLLKHQDSHGSTAHHQRKRVHLTPEQKEKLGQDLDRWQRARERGFGHDQLVESIRSYPSSAHEKLEEADDEADFRNFKLAARDVANELRQQLAGISAEADRQDYESSLNGRSRADDLRDDIEELEELADEAEEQEASFAHARQRDDTREPVDQDMEDIEPEDEELGTRGQTRTPEERSIGLTRSWVELADGLQEAGFGTVSGGRLTVAPDKAGEADRWLREKRDAFAEEGREGAAHSADNLARQVRHEHDLEQLEYSTEIGQEPWRRRAREQASKARGGAGIVNPKGMDGGVVKLTRSLRKVQLSLDGKNLVAIGCVVREGGDVLMGRKPADEDSDMAGQWVLPGGHVEEGEDPAAACVREIAEETGMTVVVGEELLVTDKGDNELHFFRCTVSADTPEDVPQQTPELEEPGFYSPDEQRLDELNSEVVGRAVTGTKELHKGFTHSHDGWGDHPVRVKYHRRYFQVSSYPPGHPQHQNSAQEQATGQDAGPAAQASKKKGKVLPKLTADLDLDNMSWQDWEKFADDVKRKRGTFFHGQWKYAVHRDAMGKPYHRWEGPRGMTVRAYTGGLSGTYAGTRFRDPSKSGSYVKLELSVPRKDAREDRPFDRTFTVHLYSNRAMGESSSQDERSEKQRRRALDILDTVFGIEGSKAIYVRGYRDEKGLNRAADLATKAVLRLQDTDGDGWPNGQEDGPDVPLYRKVGDHPDQLWTNADQERSERYYLNKAAELAGAAAGRLKGD